MKPVSTRVKRKRTRGQTLGISAVLLLPILVLIGLAAMAAGSVQRPAPAVSADSRP